MVDTNLDLNIDIGTVPDLPFPVLKQYYMQLYNQETRILMPWKLNGKLGKTISRRNIIKDGN